MRFFKWLPAVVLLSFPLIAFAQIGALVSPGELSKAHSKFSGVKNCNVCHAGKKEVLEQNCLACHKDLQARISARKGYHAEKASGCMKCHTEHLGKNFDIRGLDRKTFEHSEAGYLLTGKHQSLDCSSCHKTRSFLGLTAACLACHKDPHRGNLPDCENCHSAEQNFKKISFNHATTKYPLTGAHANVACMTCHKQQVFRGLPFANCTSCHTDPHRSSLGVECTKCHTVERWKSPAVKHTRFPLEGKHVNVGCVKCHPNGKWKLEKFSSCSDCHRDPHLGQFTAACAQCHTVAGFRPASYSHEGFQLQGAHTKVVCAQCHKEETGDFPAGKGTAVRYRPLGKNCIACHKDIHAAQMGPRCEDCHTVNTFKIQAFDHSRTRYPLDKDHIKLACEKCHKQDPKTGAVRYKPLSTGCASCHGDVHLGQFKQQCEQCHAAGGLRFDHATSSFPLAGKHLVVACEKCHRLERGKFPAGTGETVRYKLSAATCASCHQDIHRGQFRQDCAACHTVNGFLPTTFSHAKSAFPLNGAHAEVRCEKCHKPEIVQAPAPSQFVRYVISNQCGSCHEDPHSGRFGKDCAKCHTTEEWKTINRAFHKKGVFPLSGRHYEVPCSECHWEGKTAGTPTRCYDCHWIRRQDDLYRTRLGTNCGECHKTTSWTAVEWNHQTATGVAIGAQHRVLGCDSCHKNQNFATAGADCYSCHRSNYDQTTAPSHRAAAFPITCDICHRPSDPGWHATAFNHTSVFPLVGQHATSSCQSCHRNNVYQGLPRDCYSCHKSDYDRTADPNHKAAGFPQTCESCHNPADPNWNAPSFNHNTYFKLVGQHATLDCAACHKNGVYSGTPRDCYGCHRKDYQNARDPNHVASGFSTRCDSCHSASSSSWQEASTDHSFFKLVGIHKTLSCDACHKSGIFQGTPRECYGCHKADYDATKNPNHRTSGFGTECKQCHKASDADWHQAKFDHNTVFPLLGAHATLDCAACHKNGIYAGTPRDCYGCHKADYDQTNDPNHKAAGFPTTCENCHKASDSSWSQAVFNHTWFPITSGRHSGFSCSQCHPNSGNYSIFTCTNCHTKSATDSQHSGVGGYSYNSQACYSCHPTGRGD